MKKQIKTFRSLQLGELEEKVNAFLTEKGAKVVDVQYSTSADGNSVAYSVMVVYVTEK